MKGKETRREKWDRLIDQYPRLERRPIELLISISKKRERETAAQVTRVSLLDNKLTLEKIDAAPPDDWCCLCV